MILQNFYQISKKIPTNKRVTFIIDSHGYKIIIGSYVAKMKTFNFAWVQKNSFF